MADLILTMEDAAGAGGLGPATLGSLLLELKDALGKDNLQWRQEPTDLINAWIAKLANLHNWNWRQAYAEIGTVADQNYVALPSDFGKLHLIIIKGTTLPMQPTTWPDLQRKRATNATIAAGGFFYATRFGTQAATNGAPAGRIELFPTPVGTEAAYFAASYDRLLPALGEDGDVPDVPIIHHPLIRQFVRAEALRYDGGDASQWAIERDELARMLPDHLAIDGQIQHEGGGQIQGAVSAWGQQNPRQRPHNSIGFAQ